MQTTHFIPSSDMMISIKHLFIIFLSCQTFFLAHTSRHIFPANILREHPNKCFAFALCKVFIIDDGWELPGCGKGTCTRSRTGLVEIIHSCPEVYIEPECYLEPVDIKLSYPLCCPRKVCPGDKDFKGYICRNNMHRPTPNTHV